MKNVNRIVGCILAVALAGTVLTGCGESKSTSTNTKEKTKFTYWVPMPAVLASHVSTMADVTMYKELAKKTNIDIVFRHPPVGQENEQFSLMLASRDLTDLIEYSFSKYPGGPDKAIGDGVIVKLNDLVNSYSPNFKIRMDENETYRKQSKSNNGDYYGYPSLNVGDVRTFGGLMLRQDLLDELGLEKPETLAEWEHVFKELKTKKNIKAPFTGDKTLFSLNTMNHHFNSAFDVGLGYYVTDNKVQFASLDPKYKEFLMTMNRWYKEGILDNEYETNNAAAVDAKMTGGDSVVCYGFAAGTLARYLNAMKTRNSNYKLVGVQHPVMNKGDEPRFMERQKDANDPFLSITTACKKPDVAAQWMDFFYSDEGALFRDYGVENVTYTMVDGKPKFMDHISKPDGLSGAEAMAMHARGNYPSPGIKTKYVQEIDRTNPIAVTADEAKITWSKYSQNALKTLMPPISMSQEESQEFTTIMVDIETYCDEMVSKFIHGYESFDNYDKFINKLKSMKIERAVELNQIALDRYNKR